MLRFIFRYLFVGLAALSLVFIALKLSPAVRAEDKAISACRNEPTALCLIDLGVGMAKHARSLPPHMREVEMLAQMGRIEDARALGSRVLSEKDRSPEDIDAAINRIMASHRITAAIRNGIDLETAIHRTPDVNISTLWISAVDLLGHNPYDVRSGPRIIPDDQVRHIVSDMAERIAKMAQEEPELKASSLMDAAELYTALGNRTEVIQLLESLPQQNNPLGNPSEDLIRLVGSRDALRLYREAGGIHPHILLTAASVETEPSLATEYLERAFTAFSSEEPRPNFHWMERTVELAAHRGLQPLALELAHELSRHAETAPSGLPVFDHIKAARALMIAGADEGEVRDRLLRAQSSFPQDDRQIVGIGFVSGLIIWGSSGLDAQARREIANLWARLGETDTAIQIMDGIEDPVFAWTDMLTPEIPIETLEDLLDAASNSLSRDELAYIKAQHAQNVLALGATEDQKLWARETAKALVQDEPFDGNLLVLIYTTLTRIGVRLEDKEIQNMALEKMAEAALNSREFSALITAGFKWYQSDLQL